MLKSLFFLEYIKVIVGKSAILMHDSFFKMVIFWFLFGSLFESCHKRLHTLTFLPVFFSFYPSWNISFCNSESHRGRNCSVSFFKNHVSVLLCGCFKARRRPQEVLPAQTDGLSFYICPSCWMIRAWWKVRAPQTAGLDRDVTGAWKWFLQPLKITLNRLKHTETVLYSAASHSTVWLSISLNTKVLP